MSKTMLEKPYYYVVEDNKMKVFVQFGNSYCRAFDIELGDKTYTDTQLQEMCEEAIDYLNNL